MKIKQKKKKTSNNPYRLTKTNQRQAQNPKKILFKEVKGFVDEVLW